MSVRVYRPRRWLWAAPFDQMPVSSVIHEQLEKLGDLDKNEWYVVADHPSSRKMARALAERLEPGGSITYDFQPPNLQLWITIVGRC